MLGRRRHVQFTYLYPILRIPLLIYTFVFLLVPSQWIPNQWLPSQTTHPEQVYQSPLTDPQNKISPEFKVPKGLMKRTKFWFNIHTLYSSYHNVIHHSDYPWVIFTVVNTKKFFSTNEDINVQHQKAQNFISQRIKNVQSSLLKISTAGSSKYSIFDKQILSVLQKYRLTSETHLKHLHTKVRSQTGQKDYFISAYLRSGYYLNSIEKILRTHHIPKELARLPFIKSYFNDRIHNQTKASGLWQIKAGVGKHFALVNDKIDERNSPLKATNIAAQLLKHHQKNLKSWPHSVLSYKHGISGVKKGLREIGSQSIVHFIQHYKSDNFGFSTQNFYPSFLAVLHAEQYMNEIFEGSPFLQQKAKPIRVKTYTLETPIEFRDLLTKHEITAQNFIHYNLDLKKSSLRNLILPKGYTYYIPQSFLSILAQNE